MSSVTLATLDVVQQLTKIPSAAKSWRLQVGDAFSDNRFFTASPVDPVAWRPIICALFDSDKERFGDLLGASATLIARRLVAHQQGVYRPRLPPISSPIGRWRTRIAVSIYGGCHLPCSQQSVITISPRCQASKKSSSSSSGPRASYQKWKAKSGFVCES